MGAEVVEFPGGNVQDIPAMLEKVAQGLRGGVFGDVTIGVGVFRTAEGEVHVCGWGADADDLRTIGLLNLGVGWMQSFCEAK